MHQLLNQNIDNEYMDSNSPVLNQQVALRYVDTIQKINFLNQIQSLQQQREQQEQQERENISSACSKTACICVYGLMWFISSMFKEIYGSDACVSLRKCSLIFGCGLLVFCFISFFNIFSAIVIKNHSGLNNMDHYLDIIAGCFNILMTFILLVSCFVIQRLWYVKMMQIVEFYQHQFGSIQL